MARPIRNVHTKVTELFFENVSLPWVFKVQHWFMTLITLTEWLEFGYRITKKQYFALVNIWSKYCFLVILKPNPRISPKTLRSDVLTVCTVNLSHESLLHFENSGRRYILWKWLGHLPFNCSTTPENALQLYAECESFYSQQFTYCFVSNQTVKSRRTK